MPKRSTLIHIRDPYLASEGYDAVLSSSVEILKAILTNPKILDMHKKNIIKDVVLWRMSEVDGKWTTRYRSMGVLKGDDEPVNHEHVFTRKNMTEQLLEHPADVEQILRTVTGCIVTKSEHKKLSKIKDVDGWDRYKQAGVQVWDMKINKRFI